MNTVEKIVKNESLDDIIAVFALFKATPDLEMMIRSYNRESLEHGELESAYTRLIEAGVLANGKKGLAIKGPNWKAPQFVIEKRYIE